MIPLLIPLLISNSWTFPIVNPLLRFCYFPITGLFRCDSFVNSFVNLLFLDFHRDSFVNSFVDFRFSGYSYRDSFVNSFDDFLFSGLSIVIPLLIPLLILHFGYSYRDSFVDSFVNFRFPGFAIVIPLLIPLLTSYFLDFLS